MKLNITVLLLISLLAFYGSSITTLWYESFVFTFEPAFRFIPILLLISWLPKLLVYGAAGLVMSLWVQSNRPYRWAATMGVVALLLDSTALPINEMGHASITELVYFIVVFFVPLYGVLAGAKLHAMKVQSKPNHHSVSE